MSRSLTFLSEITNLSVKISTNFEAAVLVNESENYLLNKGTDDMWHQHSMSWLKGKTVRKIAYGAESNFVFICCKDYDRDIDIMCSSNDKFKISVPRSI